MDACRILRSLCWGIVGISLPVVYPCAVTLVISQVILSLPPQQVLPCNDTPALHPVRPSRAGLCRRAFEMQRTPACRQSRLLTPEADTVDHLHAQHTVAQRIRSPPAGPARPHMVGAHIDLKPRNTVTKLVPKQAAGQHTPQGVRNHPKTHFGMTSCSSWCDVLWFDSRFAPTQPAPPTSWPTAHSLWNKRRRIHHQTLLTRHLEEVILRRQDALVPVAMTP